MLAQLFQKQREALDYFYTHLDHAACEEIVVHVQKCCGTLFLTGVGKSGFIAQKIAATLLSTGTKALFLPPLDALHGDLAMVTPDDLVMILSKSGETEEILQLLPFLRNKGARLIGVTSTPSSRLWSSVDTPLLLPCLNELCPFDLAPTISTEIQLLFGDVLAITLMEAKGVSLDQYASNHPSGQIGRRAQIKVKDLMISQEKAPFCLPTDHLEDVLKDISHKRCGCLIIKDKQGTLKGIFTDGDLRRALEKKGKKALKEKIETLMTPTPKTINTEDLAWKALRIMEADQNHPITVLPVLYNREKVIGIIKMHDILQAGI